MCVPGAKEEKNIPQHLSLSVYHLPILLFTSTLSPNALIFSFLFLNMNFYALFIYLFACYLSLKTPHTERMESDKT